MPETAAAYTNGHTNGHNYKYEMEDGQTFLFTSESVGEGHPGKSHKDIHIEFRYIIIFIH